MSFTFALLLMFASAAFFVFTFLTFLQVINIPIQRIYFPVRLFSWTPVFRAWHGRSSEMFSGFHLLPGGWWTHVRDNCRSVGLRKWSIPESQRRGNSGLRKKDIHRMDYRSSKFIHCEIIPLGRFVQECQTVRALRA